ncbi:hypothetical protein CERZMDRAFT_50397 [Cercospora zeae-maydis SCOH1-5]|uniref:F-box domain-containing protein n=1 Tax=Cercospora zeae-maydis SCOH1-5 TaxID=717836 RepID=A0A6A6F626_9PEZI|nr:hypothetical protein CERZMDRAFT_50397 [Cercospora zeae-maydis SCOH1-5]
MVPNIRIPKSLEGLVYPYPNLKDYTLDENELERTCPLDLGRYYVDPQYDLGTLDGLPLEVLDDVLVQLDLRSLMDFRAVNQRAMRAVDAIPQFRTIVKHSASSLRGILSIEAASDSTCQDLYQAISSPRCELCNDFGGYIYLLNCSRVCFLCFSENDRYLPLSPFEVTYNYGLDRNHIVGLRRMRSIPGRYSPNEKDCPTRLLLVDRESARGAGIALHGSALAMEQHRFMAIVRAPYVSLPDNPAEWGFHCAGCERKYRSRPLHWRRKYASDTFDLHIRQCGSVINGEHCLQHRDSESRE